jgi:hypothetical protein
MLYSLLCNRFNRHIRNNQISSKFKNCQGPSSCLVTEVAAGIGQSATDAIIAEIKEDTKDILTKMLAEQHAQKPRSFSTVPSTIANDLLTNFKITEINGCEEFPIIVPPDLSPCPSFDFSRYPDENSGTPDLMRHHQQQLTRLGVPFGRGAYAMYDLRGSTTCLRFVAKEQLYHGTTDCCLAPNGLLGNSPAMHLRIGFEHKKIAKASSATPTVSKGACS